MFHLMGSFVLAGVSLAPVVQVSKAVPLSMPAKTEKEDGSGIDRWWLVSNGYSWVPECPGTGQRWKLMLRSEKGTCSIGYP